MPISQNVLLNEAVQAGIAIVACLLLAVIVIAIGSPKKQQKKYH